MKLEPLGELTRDSDIEDWFDGGYVNVPYLGGQELQIIVQGIEHDEAPQEFSDAIREFLSLSEADRAEATPYVYRNYREFVEAVGKDEFDFSIDEQSDVWKHVYLTTAYISRRDRRDKDVYVQLTGNCDWEQEHGLQIVLRRGRTLSRVSDQDGHLTTADAYDLPEDQNTIIYQG